MNHKRLATNGLIDAVVQTVWDKKCGVLKVSYF